MINEDEIKDFQQLQNQFTSRYKKNSQVQTIEFSSYSVPQFKEKQFREWINCGPDNLWPNYLINLANNCAVHSRILESKARQIAGEGLTVEDSEDKDQLSQMNDFIKKIKFNKKTLRRIAYDQQIFGYWFLGITWNKARTGIAKIYHVDASSIRVGIPDKDTREVNFFYYSQDWTQFRKTNFIPEEIPVFDPDNRIDENQLLMVRSYQPNTRFYGLPNYRGALDSIEAYHSLGETILSNCKNGLSPSLNISFNNGEPTDEERDVIYKTINALYKGSKNAGRFILSFNKSKENATTIEPIQVSNLSEVYAGIKEKCQNDIVIAHGLTSPVIAGIPVPVGIGNSGSEMAIANEAFFNQVIAPAQLEIEEVMQELLEINGFNLKVWIKDSQPISYQYDDSTLMSILTVDEMRKKIGYNPLSDFDKKNLAVNITQPVTPDSGATATPAAPTAEGMSDDGQSIAPIVNSLLTNLTGRQQQNFLRIIKQHSSGKITRETAHIMLNAGFGFTDEQINEILKEVEEEEMAVSTGNLQPYVKQVDEKDKLKNK